MAALQEQAYAAQVPSPVRSRTRIMAADWDAERYHRLSNPQFGWGRRVLERLAPRPGERILDVGCGTGRLTAELAAGLHHGWVIGVDVSAAMLAEAAAHGPAAVAAAGPRAVGRHPVRLAFVRADGAALPFAGRFDAIVSTAAFHWIPDHDRLFASLYTALAPGGRLVAQCGGGPNLKRLRRRARALMSAPRFQAFFRDWTDPWYYAGIPETRVRLDRAGFTAVEVWLEEAPTSMADARAYADFLSTVCVRAQMDRLPDAERAAFVASLAADAALDEPPFTLDYWRLNIDARKR